MQEKNTIPSVATPTEAEQDAKKKDASPSRDPLWELDNPDTLVVLHSRSWLSGLGWFLGFAVCFLWGYNDDILPKEPLRSFPRGVSFAGLFLLFGWFFRTTILSYKQMTSQNHPSPSSSQKFFLWAWALFAAISLGIFAPICLPFAAIWLLQGLYRAFLEKSDTEKTYMISPGELCVTSLLLVGFVAFLGFYGIWMVVLAPFLSLILGVVWAFQHRASLQKAWAWWGGFLLLCTMSWWAVPLSFYSHVHGAGGSEGTFGRGGVLLAAEYAPFWSTKMRVMLLDPSDYKELDRGAQVVPILTRVWLKQPVSFPVEEKIVYQLSYYGTPYAAWLSYIKQHTKLQKPVIKRLLRHLDCSRRPHCNQEANWTHNGQQKMLKDLYKALPKHREYMSEQLLKMGFSGPGCATKVRQCSSLSPGSLKAKWIEQILHKGFITGQNHFTAMFLDPAWSVLKENFEQEKTTFATKSLKQLQAFEKKASSLTLLYTEMTLYSGLHGILKPLQNDLPKTQKGNYYALLSRTIKRNLQAKTQAAQLFGLLLLGKVCRYPYVIELKTCYALQQALPSKAWHKLQKHLGIYLVKEAVDAIKQIKSGWEDMETTRKQEKRLETMKKELKLLKAKLKDLKKASTAHKTTRTRKVR